MASYLQKVLYEGKEKDAKNEEVIHRLWLALYEPPTPIGLPYGLGCLVNYFSSNNVLISYTSNQGGMRDIHGVTLFDTEGVTRVKKGEGIFDQVGKVLWRSPEAQTGTRVGKTSDIWSFGVTAVYGVTKMIIFAYDKPKDGDMPEVEVLYNMLSYIKDSSWHQVLIGLDQNFDKNTPRNPISIWRDIEGLEPGAKECFGRLLNLNPGLRPPAEEVLDDPRFFSP